MSENSFNIGRMHELFLERLEAYQKQVETADREGLRLGSHERLFVEAYRTNVRRFFDKVVPDGDREAPPAEGYIGERRLKGIAWQYNRYAWFDMDTVLHSGFGNLEGYVNARAEAKAAREFAMNLWDIAEGTWIPDMSTRIPER